MKLGIVLIILSVLLSFPGCISPVDEPAMEETQSLTTFPEETISETVALKVHDIPYLGELPECATGDLRIMKFSKDASGGATEFVLEQKRYWGFSIVYTEVDEDAEGHFNCGWRLDLSHLEVMGQTDTGALVYAAKDSTTQPVLLLVTETDTDRWTWLPEDGILDIRCCSIEDFEVYLDGKLQENTALAAEVLMHHTKASKTYGIPVADDDPDWQIMRYVRKDCPALSYEIEFLVYSSGVVLYSLSAEAGGYIPRTLE